ncbi:hypothetical protein DM01DRAFT_8398 [Hesseltinella vesiculosa]|uniref:F-box domain-containing protein n=1 Tax=Hesseltinella vesiculosa TaxID=101127 RepID=A0A1X2GPX8_9FUNG|nr:hypothetical protein DM01DRAFT_8398 [Hesseltinella vesiculosa]
MDYLSQLPQEIIELIAHKLSQHDLFVFCTVCRAIQNKTFPLLYQHVTLTDSQYMERLATTLAKLTNDTMKPLGYFTRSLTFKCGALDVSLLDAIALACPFVTTLRFPGMCLELTVSNQSARTSSDYPTQLPRPYTNFASNIQYTGNEDYRSCLFLGFKSFYDCIVSNHPHLTSLSFTHVGNFDDDEFRMYMRKLPAGLVELSMNMHDRSLTIDDVEIIHKRCPLLESLDLGDSLRLAEVNEPPIVAMNYVLKEFSIRSESRNANCWSWLWYASKKYGHQLQTFRLNNAYNIYMQHDIPTTEQGRSVHNASLDFAKQHATTLRKLELNGLGIYGGFWGFMRGAKRRGGGMSSLTRVEFKGVWFSTVFESILGSYVYELMVFAIQSTIRELSLSLAHKNVKVQDLCRALGGCPHLTNLGIEESSDTCMTFPLPFLLDQCSRLKQLTLKVSNVDTSLDWPTHHPITSFTLEQATVTGEQLTQALAAMHFLKKLNLLNIVIDEHHRPPDHKYQKPQAAIWAIPNPNMSITINGLSYSGLLGDKNYRLILGSSPTEQVSFWSFP